MADVRFDMAKQFVSVTEGDRPSVDICVNLTGTSAVTSSVRLTLCEDAPEPSSGLQQATGKGVARGGRRGRGREDGVGERGGRCGEEGREDGVYEKVKVEYAMDGVRCAPQLLFSLHSLATVDQDFSFSATLLTFQPGEERLCAHANITDDPLGELDEEFHVCLERVDVFTVIGQPNTTITIVDNDSECGGCIAIDTVQAYCHLENSKLPKQGYVCKAKYTVAHTVN